MLKNLIRLQVKAQTATSGPPLGPALGQFGVPTMDFCKRFNDLSKEYEKGVLVNTMVFVNMDRTYEIKLKGPKISYLLKKAIEIEKGLSYSGYLANTNILLTNYMLYELFKLTEIICKRTYGYYKTIKGSAQSCGFILLNYEYVDAI
jgi:ribosomal protein L11